MLLINSKQQQKPLIYASKQKYSSASHCPKKEGNKENKAEAF